MMDDDAILKNLAEKVNSLWEFLIHTSDSEYVTNDTISFLFSHSTLHALRSDLKILKNIINSQFQESLKHITIIYEITTKSILFYLFTVVHYPILAEKCSTIIIELISLIIDVADYLDSEKKSLNDDNPSCVLAQYLKLYFNDLPSSVYLPMDPNLIEKKKIDNKVSKPRIPPQSYRFELFTAFIYEILNANQIHIHSTISSRCIFKSFENQFKIPNLKLKLGNCCVSRNSLSGNIDVKLDIVSSKNNNISDSNQPFQLNKGSHSKFLDLTDRNIDLIHKWIVALVFFIDKMILTSDNNIYRSNYLSNYFSSYLIPLNLSFLSIPDHKCNQEAIRLLYNIVKATSHQVKKNFPIFLDLKEEESNAEKDLVLYLNLFETFITKAFPHASDSQLQNGSQLNIVGYPRRLNILLRSLKNIVKHTNQYAVNYFKDVLEICFNSIELSNSYTYLAALELIYEFLVNIPPNFYMSYTLDIVSRLILLENQIKEKSIVEYTSICEHKKKIMNILCPNVLVNE